MTNTTVDTQRALVERLHNRTATVGVIGLGYVGLPLAVEFGKHRPVVGFDIDRARIADLEAGHDRTLEIDDHELRQARQLRYSADGASLAECNVYIVTVPTPIDSHKKPDLSPLIRASESAQKGGTEELEERYIRSVLRKVGFNYSRAAEVLGINRKTLLEKRRRYGFVAHSR